MKLTVKVILASFLIFSSCVYTSAEAAAPELRSRGRGGSKTDRFSNSVTEAPTTTTTPPNCQQNDLLNQLLLRMLLTNVQTTTRNPLLSLFNLNPMPSGVLPQTTVITTSAVSTVTQLFSTVLSVIFQNKKIPTTIFSSSEVVVTELQTITSTLPSALEPTALFRLKREIDDKDGNGDSLESSLIAGVASSGPILPTRPLEHTNTLEPLEFLDSLGNNQSDLQQWIAVLSHPEVRDAWDNFLSVLNRVRRAQSSEQSRSL